MVTLRGLAKTLMTTKQPYRIVFLKFSDQPKQVTLRNGCKLMLTWPQFRMVRDNYPFIKTYAIEQVKDGGFRIKSGDFVFVGSLQIVCLVAGLRRKNTIEQVDRNVLRIKSDKFELVGSNHLLYSIQELESGEYDHDCSGKVVLDVGGFQGESAVFFSNMGAKKVVIYEPVTAHHKFIQENVRLNHVNAEIHDAGIASEDGIQTIHYDETGLGFGFGDKGGFEMKIKVVSTTKVIHESYADIAKFDCEGAEASLLGVPNVILREIKLYMIEMHTKEIRNAIVERFVAAGFHIVRDTSKANGVSVVFFSRDHPPNS